MLSVILLILKIIGIAILVLLGILLFLLIIILFVPIRYRVKLEHSDNLVLEAGVSWLLHLVHGRISQSSNKRRIWIRIMGFKVYDSLAKDELTSRDEEKPIEEKITNDSISPVEGIDSKDDKAPVKDMESKDDKSPVEDMDSKDDKSPVEDIDSKDDIISKDQIKSKNVISSKDEETSKNTIASVDAKEEGEHSKRSLLSRVYKNLKIRISNLYNGIKRKITALIQKLLSIKNKAGLILEFINDDTNRKGFRFAYNTLKRILKHILPRKLHSKLIFGTGDPCSTGQVLGIFGMLYGFYGNKLQITPDFENKIFQGSHYARGRIRIWTLLIIVIKLLLDKRFKDLKANFKLLKEAL